MGRKSTKAPEPTTEPVVAETETQAESTDETVTATVFKRNEKGLIEGVAYAYKEDGKIDWRKMIKPEYVVLKKEAKEDIEKATGKAFDEVSVEEVEDKYLLLLLNGVKELAQLRGFNAVRYVNKVAQPGFVSVDCEIDWKPNFETGEWGETFSDGADATPDNVEGWYANYLTTAANNRAFVRSVRNYLGIYIIGKDEMGPSAKIDSSTVTSSGVAGFGPHAMLDDLLKKKGRTLEDLKDFLKKKEVDYLEELNDWNGVNDIPKERIFSIAGLIKGAEKKA